jgi:type I restriction enzyme, R subunit
VISFALREWPSVIFKCMAAQVIEELIGLQGGCAKLTLATRSWPTEEELAFYDALETNDGVVKVLGDEKLCFIARELADAVRRNTSIDWTMRENVRAQIMVKRILRNGYSPDLKERATETALKQAELLSWETAV